MGSSPAATGPNEQAEQPSHRVKGERRPGSPPQPALNPNTTNPKPGCRLFPQSGDPRFIPRTNCLADRHPLNRAGIVAQGTAHPTHGAAQLVGWAVPLRLYVGDPVDHTGGR
jgi:hypothetical protein